MVTWPGKRPNCNLVAVTRELTGSAQVVGLFVLMSAVSCIRFRHMQRSHFVA